MLDKVPQRDKDNELSIIKALRQAGIEVLEWDWKYIADLEQWYLLVRTTSIVTQGPSAVLQAQKDALSTTSIPADIASRVRLIKAVADRGVDR